MITRPRCCSLSGSPSHPDTERQTVGWTHSINITGLYLLCSEVGVGVGAPGWVGGGGGGVDTKAKLLQRRSVLLHTVQ